MVKSVYRLIEKRLNRAAATRWARRARATTEMPTNQVQRLQGQARSLKGQLDRFLYSAEDRAALPLIGSNAMKLPLNTDYALRPTIWRGPIENKGMASLPRKSQLVDDTSIFHDCPRAEISYRQVRNTRSFDMAPYGLSLEVFRFEGAFVSVMVPLDAGALDGLTKRHVIRVSGRFQLERQIEVFARLNVEHGPNREEVVREFVFKNDCEAYVEFDLAVTGINEKRIVNMWLDLIFEDPNMNRIIVRDVVVSRHPRAEV